jgi:hypothetical protein
MQPRLDNGLASLPVSGQDELSMLALAELECAKFAQTADETEQARIQERVVTTLMERRPDFHARHLRRIMRVHQSVLGYHWPDKPTLRPNWAAATDVVIV